MALVCLALSVPAGAATIKVSVSDADGKPVEDSVVFVYETKEAVKPPEDPYLIDQVNKEFVPHVLPVVLGAKVRFPNKDDIHHEIYSFSPAKSFEQPLYKGEPAAPIVFEKPGVVKLGCNIHDWMSGVILVLPNKYFAKTDADGKASVDIPEGAKSVELAVFHERLRGSVDDTKTKVKVSEAAASWKLSLKPEKKKKRSAVGYQ